MYVFQFCDATWRISLMTNTKFPLPVAGTARALFDAVYRYESAARNAMREIEALATTKPDQFWRQR
jgi:hypothetical protein